MEAGHDLTGAADGLYACCLQRSAGSLLRKQSQPRMPSGNLAPGACHGLHSLNALSCSYALPSGNETNSNCIPHGDRK